MIKTPISLPQWAGGAFFYYPISSFISTPFFLETPPKYPTFIYILLLPLQIIVTIHLFHQVLTTHRLKPLDIAIIGVFLGYYFTGFITRYYRYLWPFQFSLAILTLVYLQEMLLTRPKINTFLFLVFACLIPLQLYYVFCHHQTSYLYTSPLLQPDYYHRPATADNPISFLNQSIHQQPPPQILDASKNFLGRFNFGSRVFLCNWYWYDKAIDISQHKGDKPYGQQLLNQFNYIITSNPPQTAGNYCLDFLLPQLPNYRPIYQDKQYQIYIRKT
jgi:hypothetical protein